MSSNNFNAAEYLAAYPIVSAMGMDAKEHFERFGKRLGYEALQAEHTIEPRIIKNFSPFLGAEIVLYAAFVNGPKLSELQWEQINFLRGNGRKICVGLNCSDPLSLDEKFDDIDLLYINNNVGFDFGLWAELSRQLGDVSSAKSLVFLNDSLVPAAKTSSFSTLLRSIQGRPADVIFATKSNQIKEHSQSFFFAGTSSKGIKVLQKYLEDLEIFSSKDELIREVELKFSDNLVELGASVESLFTTRHEINPSIFNWKDIVHTGFPFVKVSALEESATWKDTEGLQNFFDDKIVACLPTHFLTREIRFDSGASVDVSSLDRPSADKPTCENISINRPYLTSFEYNRMKAEQFSVLAEQSLTPIRLRAKQYEYDAHMRLKFRIGPIVNGDIRIAILVPVFNLDPKWMFEMIGSVLGQSYQNWELIIVDDGSTKPSTLQALQWVGMLDTRIKIIFSPVNGGISDATNRAFASTTCKYIALLDHDDMLTSDALAKIAVKIEEENYPDLIYSDEFKIDGNNVVSDLFAKPNWSPFLLLNSMYIGHLSVYKASIINKVGGWRNKFDFSQDYDLALRVSEVTSNIVHLNEFIYAWRMIPGSAAQGDKPDARQSNIAALQDACDRRGWKATAVALPSANRVVWTQIERPLVSIIIPSDNVANILQSVDSIIANTAYLNYEILVVTKIDVWKACNISNEKLIFVPYEARFNFSDKCNVAARHSKGEYLVFYNDDVRTVTKDWIECILEYAALPSVGAVGPKLLYENNTIQHAGMITGVRRLVGTAFHCLPSDTNFHFNFAQFVRDVSLICGALLAIKKTVFECVGGYDSDNAGIAHSDVDLCLRLIEHGYTNIYTPHATLIHIGHVSIGEEELIEKRKGVIKRERNDLYLIDRFGKLIEEDPYFTDKMVQLAYQDSQDYYRLHYPPNNLYTEKNFSATKSALVVSHDLTASGAPLVAYDVAAYFKTCGYYVHCVSAEDGYFRSKYHDLGIPVSIDTGCLSDHEDSTFYFHNYDVVVLNTILCWRLARRLNRLTRTIWYVHEIGLIDALVSVEPELREFLNTGVQTFCTSRLIADKLKYYGAEPIILEPGVRDPITTLAPKERLRVGVFGSIEPRKGQDIAIDAVKLASQNVSSHLSLTIVGRTLDEGFYEALQEKADAVANITFTGELKPEACLAVMNSVDVVFVSSREEALSLVGIEGLSRSKVVVLAKTTGLNSYLQHGISGLVANVGTAEEFSLLLQRLVEEPDLANALGRAGRKVYERCFSVDAFHRKLDIIMD